MVVGVLPAGFRVLLPGVAEVPEHIDTFHAMRVDWSDADRGGWFIRTIARLREGATVAEAQALVDLARVQGRVLAVSQNYRFYPAPILAAQLMAKRELGPADLVRLEQKDLRPLGFGDGLFGQQAGRFHECLVEVANPFSRQHDFGHGPKCALPLGRRRCRAAARRACEEPCVWRS